MSKLRRSDPTLSALTKLSVVIPARDEEACIVSTVEHLHLELRLHAIPHEIVVVDDGSTDRTWDILQDLRTGPADTDSRSSADAERGYARVRSGG